jgi:hypothetical protein
MSLEYAERMMEMPLDPDHKQFARLVGIKQQVMQSVFQVMARVRSGDIRPTGDDGLSDLLDRTVGSAAGRTALASPLDPRSSNPPRTDARQTGSPAPPDPLLADLFS